MTSNSNDKLFVSEVDKFIADYDKQHPEKSASQLEDIKKSERIAKLRDHAREPDVAGPKIWEEFFRDKSSGE